MQYRLRPQITHHQGFLCNHLEQISFRSLRLSAITGQTAAEIVHTSADANKEFMGLTTWKNARHGRIVKSDTGVAKNYLQEKEIKRLERTISAFFDYIEIIIENRVSFTIGPWKNLGRA